MNILPKVISLRAQLIKPYIDLLGDCENDKLSYKKAVSRVYREISNPLFSVHYENLLREVSQLLSLNNDVAFQVKPTFRIQATGSKSVPFHIDKWSGHPDQIINVWLPITPTNNYNCLHIVDRIHSVELISLLEYGKISLDELERQCNKFSTPFPVQPGEALLFNNSLLHGTVVNNHNTLRASIDFRIALDTNSLASKKIGRDYKLSSCVQAFEPQKTYAHSIVYASSKYCNVSHSIQRAAIDQYSHEVGLEILTESSEFVGCQGIPQIMQYLASSDIPIIMFSIECFDALQKDLLENLPEEYKARLHFVLEAPHARI